MNIFLDNQPPSHKRDVVDAVDIGKIAAKFDPVSGPETSRELTDFITKGPDLVADGSEGLLVKEGANPSTYPIHSVHPPATANLDDLKKLIWSWFDPQYRRLWWGGNRYHSLSSDRYLVPPSLRGRWKTLSKDDKFLAATLYASQFVYQDRGVAISLNLSPAAQRRLTDRRIERPMRLLSDEINRAARRVLGFPLDIALAFQFSPAGMLHLHGVILLPEGVRLQQIAADLRKVLRIAGGKLLGMASARQARVKPLDFKSIYYVWENGVRKRRKGALGSGIGWGFYSLRDQDETVSQLPTAGLYIGYHLTRKVREYHSQNRSVAA